MTNTEKKCRCRVLNNYWTLNVTKVQKTKNYNCCTLVSADTEVLGSWHELSVHFQLFGAADMSFQSFARVFSFLLSLYFLALMCDTVIVLMTNRIEWNHITPYLLKKDHSLFCTSVTLSHFSFLDTGKRKCFRTSDWKLAGAFAVSHTFVTQFFSQPLRCPPLALLLQGWWTHMGWLSFPLPPALLYCSCKKLPFWPWTPIIWNYHIIITILWQHCCILLKCNKNDVGVN